MTRSTTCPKTCRIEQQCQQALCAALQPTPGAAASHAPMCNSSSSRRPMQWKQVHVGGVPVPPHIKKSHAHRPCPSHAAISSCIGSDDIICQGTNFPASAFPAFSPFRHLLLTQRQALTGAHKVPGSPHLGTFTLPLLAQWASLRLFISRSEVRGWVSYRRRSHRPGQGTQLTWRCTPELVRGPP